jgi:nifR3 family TIM-barrel protein
MVQLGRLNIKNPFVLAPISMYSDIGFRLLCYDYGCSYAFTEQIYAAEFIKKSEQLKRKLDLYDNVGLQFISNNPAELKEAIDIVNRKEFYPMLENVKSIDLNLACPIPDIMEKNLGSALLNQPKLLRELFRQMKQSSNLPVSAKIRLGINSKHKKTKPYLRIAKIAEEEGLDFITIHLKTAGLLHTGKIDLESLKELRQSTKIPIIGNGDICDESTAENMLKFCDAVMIAQHAMKEPFIFKQLAHYFDNKEKLKIDITKEKIFCIKKYLGYAEKYNIGFQHIKIHMQSFLRDIKGAESAIQDLTATKDIPEIKKILRNKGFV